MDEFLKTVGAVVGLVIAGPVVYACIKWGAVVEKLDKLANSFDRYADKTDTRLEQHAERITRTEAELRVLNRVRYPRAAEG